MNIQNSFNHSIISGHSHSFDAGIAKTLGVNAAIVYNHIFYWLKINSRKKDAQMINGKYWMYETQNQMSEFLEYLSLDEVKKSILKLIKAGLLIKGKFNKNPFDKTNWYTLHDQELIKKNITKEFNGTIDRAQELDPESPTTPCIYIHKDKHKDKQLHENAAVSSSSSNEKEASQPSNKILEPKPVKVYPELQPLDIPESDKIEITSRYSHECVKNAIAWATSPQTKITKTLPAAIKWACQNKPEVPKIKTAVSSGLSDEEIFSNREIVKEYVKSHWDNLKIRKTVTEMVEFVRIGNDKIYYKDKKFKELFRHCLIKHELNYKFRN